MSDITKSTSGSIWRRWDLHIHAPRTRLSNAYGDPQDPDVWTRYIDALEASPVEVFGITDYFCCDTYFELLSKYREQYPESTKVFFPNVEFRLAESIAADGQHPHIHLIFDNDASHCGEEKLSRFFTNLQTQALDNANTKLRCSDLHTASECESATVTLDDLEKALTETFGENKLYLIGFPANNNGLRSTDTNSPRKVSLADRIDKACHLFFGNAGNTDFFLGTDRYSDGSSSEPKPVVSGSDAHSFDDLERLSGDIAGFPPTWIKGDATFVGLRQICHEPESRTFIGSEPEVLTRHSQDGTKFLDHLEVGKIDTYDERHGRWFRAVSLPLNPELTAIIGNKGSGKSAIVDIIGLLGNSRQEEYFSFLTDDPKSKKFRQPGFAENFRGTVTWATGKTETRRLSDHCDADTPETVRYLPQNYFEQLTNEIEIEQFRHEIEDVVFSHVDETEKLGKTSFSSLEETKTQQSREEISGLKKRLRELNFEIVKLEEQSSPQYRKQLTSRIEAKREELAALDAAKPKEVVKPDTESKEQKTRASEVEELSGLVAELGKKQQDVITDLAARKSRLQDAISLQERLNAFDASVRSEMAEVDNALAELGFKIADLVEFSVNHAPLNDLIGDLRKQIADRERDNEVDFKNTADLLALSTLPDLKGASEFVAGQIEELALASRRRRKQG